MTTEDSIRIEKARCGDRSALLALLEACRPETLGIAMRILENRDDAEDVCQNALVELTYRLGDLRDAAALPGFLRQIVLHQSFDFRRRKATRRTPGPSWDGANIEAEEEEAEKRIAVWEALLMLPESERETILLDLFDGYRHAEIAQELGISVPGVRSRLQSAKYKLRQDLKSLQSDSRMTVEPTVQELVDRALPGALLTSVEPDPEAWLPYAYRLGLDRQGQNHTVVIRKDVNTQRAQLLEPMRSSGIPVPTLLQGPVTTLGTSWSLWEEPNGQHLTLWTMEGTYHRFRTATDLAMDALDQLQSFTPEARRLGVPEITLQDRFASLAGYKGAWSKEKPFTDALERLAPIVANSERPLVYSHYLQYFPNWLRIKDGRLGEIVYPFGQLGDPLLDLSMVWIYDCYPFVHTGFVEQYLIRHNVPRRDFAIRLAVQTLAIVSAETLVTPSPDGEAYKNALFNLLDRAWSWIA